MARSKHAKPDEELLGELRQLRKLVKSLRQRVRQLEKKEHVFDDEQASKGEEPLPELPVGNQPILCTSCYKGTYVEFAILDKVIGTCTTCGDRKRLK